MPSCPGFIGLSFLTNLILRLIRWLSRCEEIDSSLPTGVFLACRLTQTRRMKRRQLCEYLSSMIRNCSTEDGEAEETADKAVQTALQYHSKAKIGNGGVCLMGKYHNVLYIAARLAFLFKLKNTRTCVELLEAIYSCEATFERIVSGAIFGPRVCGVLSGWKSEFDSRQECMTALDFFLTAAGQGRARFDGLRLPDVPLLCAARAVPAALALQARLPDLLVLLIRHGARLDIAPDGMMTPLETLTDLEKLYPKEFMREEDERLAECLELGRMLYPDYGEGKPLPSLKHLSRMSVRNVLADSDELPDGVKYLDIPVSLVRYILLEAD